MGLKDAFTSMVKNSDIQKQLGDGVEKIVQYGKKTLKFMEPDVQVYSHYKGGIRVPIEQEGYYAKNGLTPIAHSKESMRTIVVEGGDKPERFFIKKNTALDGYVQHENKTVFHTVGYGTKNYVASDATYNPAGKLLSYSKCGPGLTRI